MSIDGRAMNIRRMIGMEVQNTSSSLHSYLLVHVLLERTCVVTQ